MQLALWKKLVVATAEPTRTVETSRRLAANAMAFVLGVRTKWFTKGLLAPALLSPQRMKGLNDSFTTLDI